MKHAALITSIFLIPLCQCYPQLITTDAGSIIYLCVIRSRVPLSELHSYSPGQNLSRNGLCLLKCVGEKYGLISDGEVRPSSLQEVPMLPKAPDYVYEEVRGCLASLDTKIERCEDMLGVKNCIDRLFNKQ